MNILTNAFSLQMIPVFPAIPVIEEVYGYKIKELAKAGNLESAIGHADLAAVLTDELGVEIPTNRVPVRVGKDDTLYVAQYTGGRLPEGCTKLPEGAEINYYKIKIHMGDIICRDRDGKICPHVVGSCACNCDKIW